MADGAVLEEWIGKVLYSSSQTGTWAANMALETGLHPENSKIGYFSADYNQGVHALEKLESGCIYECGFKSKRTLKNTKIYNNSFFFFSLFFYLLAGLFFALLFQAYKPVKTVHIFF